MKKLNFLSVLTLLLVVGTLAVMPSLVSAEISATPTPSASPTTTPKENRQERLQERVEQRQENREENREERQEKRDDRKEDRLAKKQEIIANFIARMEKRIDAYHKRLTNISEKMQTRINKLKEEGNDMTAAQTQLDTAKKAIDDAKTNSLAVLKDMKAEDLGGGKGIGSIISQAKQIHQYFREARGVLSDVLTAIKESN